MTTDKPIHPAGIHKAEVLGHGLSFSKNINPETGKKTMQLVVKFGTEFGHIHGWFALSERAAEYTMEKLCSMGFKGQHLAELNKEPGCLIGNKCTITINHEEYRGTMRPKVSFVNSEDWQGFQVEADEEAAKASKAFDALLHKVQGGVNKDDSADAGDVPF